jgi:hypothetical protein
MKSFICGSSVRRIKWAFFVSDKSLFLHSSLDLRIRLKISLVIIEKECPCPKKVLVYLDVLSPFPQNFTSVA